MFCTFTLATAFFCIVLVAHYTNKNLKRATILTTLAVLNILV